MTSKPDLYAFAYALDYLRELVADVADGDMVVQPAGIANHPAWVLGHLVFTCEMLGGVIGVPAWLPAYWAGRYGTGSVPVADAGAYDAKEKVLAMLRDAQGRVTRAAEALTDEQLDQPFPDPSYLHVFPTVRHALTQVLVGHTSMHVGQLTVWRKAMKLPAMRRSFE